MITPNELHDILIGKEIEGVEVSTTASDEIFSIELRLKDGTVITLSPTSYSYGGQHLKVDLT